MTRPNLEAMSRAELIRELEQLEGANRRTAEGAPDRDRIVHDLEVHQIELEMQNRELRTAHERLAEVSDKYRELYDFAPVGYCTLDPDGHIRDINLRGAEFLNARRDELIGKAFIAAVPRETRPMFAAHMARCRQDRIGVTSEFALNRSRPGTRIVQMVSEPIWDDAGNAVAFRTSFVDISALKELERDLLLLSRAGETLAASLDSASTFDAVAHIAVPALADLCMLDVVAASGAVERPLVVFADRNKTALAERLRSVAERPGWQSPQARVIASGEPMLLAEVPDQIRDRIAYDDHEAATLRAANIRSLMIVPLSARSRALGALTLATTESGRRYNARDVELARGLASRIAMTMDNARLYTKARQASAARDATLAVVAHDLRTPLQAILLGTARLAATLEELGRRAEGAQPLHLVHRSVERMDRLIRDLIDVSTIEGGRFSVEVSPQPLAVIVGASIEALRPAADAKSLRVTSELAEGDPLDVRCDRDRIEQVLGNLIGNAIKFTPAAGTIVVGAERRPGEVCVSVADTGPGIAVEQLPHVFDHYWQAPATARLGHGLGLAIAKGIVEAHGGRVWADSQVGIGTTFHFTLPLARSAHEPPGPAPGAHPSDKLVLVVDDDEEARDALGHAFERAGYAVVGVGDGADALAYLRRAAAPSLILLDLAMPVMDGWAFLAERDRHPELSSIPVLVLSGQRDVTSRLAGLHAGYLHKPVAMARLLDEVAHAIS